MQPISPRITIKVSTVENAISPILGTAILSIIAESVPTLHMIRQKPGHDRDDGHHLRANTLERAYHDDLIEIILAQQAARPPAHVA